MEKVTQLFSTSLTLRACMSSAPYPSPLPIQTRSASKGIRSACTPWLGCAIGYPAATDFRISAATTAMKTSRMNPEPRLTASRAPK